MAGGINKILRNIVASSTDTEFEKVGLKADFAASSKSHVSHGFERTKGKTRDM
jgi:hypothetical protein